MCPGGIPAAFVVSQLTYAGTLSEQVLILDGHFRWQVLILQWWAISLEGLSDWLVSLMLLGHDHLTRFPIWLCLRSASLLVIYVLLFFSPFLLSFLPPLLITLNIFSKAEIRYLIILMVIFLSRGQLDNSSLNWNYQMLSQYLEWGVSDKIVLGMGVRGGSEPHSAGHLC